MSISLSRNKLMLLLVAFFLTSCEAAYSQSLKTKIPERCEALVQPLLNEVEIYFPSSPSYPYFSALIEHESCISLTHSRCCSPTSELKSSREQGIGIFQLTRTWRPDGSVRFDTLSDLARQYKKELGELSWLNVKSRTDLQLRAGVLLLRQNYNGLVSVKDPMNRLHMTDAAFNGGLGGLRKERTACGLAKDCDPQIWFGHVERYCLKSKKPLYGGRSACDINRHHASDVFNNRLGKYERLYLKYQRERES